MSARWARSILPLCAVAALLASTPIAAAQTTSPGTTTPTPEQRAAAIVGPSIV